MGDPQPDEPLAAATPGNQNPDGAPDTVVVQYPLLHPGTAPRSLEAIRAGIATVSGFRYNCARMNAGVTAIVLSSCLMPHHPACNASGLPQADLLVVNANVRTMDPEQPRAEAVAIAGNRIAAVGDQAAVRALAGKNTRVINARGRLLLPGFNDAHVHFLSGGFQLSNVDLRDARTPGEFTERLRQFAAQIPEGRWITGGDWDHESWPGAPLPTRTLVDTAVPHRPVFVSRLDGHMALANSLALKQAGITRDTPTPPGGLIVRDPATGEPTGILKDAAMGLVTRIIPAPTRDEKLAAARAATRHAASLGVTSVQDMSANEDVGVYQELLERGQLDTRIYAFWPLPQFEKLAAIGVRAGFGNPMLRIGGLKGFSDGSLGSTTAWFFEPYNDAPDTRGLATDEMMPEGAMLARVRTATAAGLQIAIHAIGDRANHEILTVFEQGTPPPATREARCRIEHAQHLRPADIPRFAHSRVIASMQPYHCADDGRWAEKRIGPGRARTTYAFRSLLDSGATLAFGSDWTVAPLNPLLGIAAAVTRQPSMAATPTAGSPTRRSPSRKPCAPSQSARQQPSSRSA